MLVVRIPVVADCCQNMQHLCYCCRLFDFTCRYAGKMKAVLLVIIAVVILNSSVLPAQDVHDTSTPLQDNSDVKKDERESETADELSDDNVADAVDENTNEESSLELRQFETIDDVQLEDFEGEVTGDEPDSDVDISSNEPESESKETLEETTPPADEQDVSAFPPPFEQSMMDSSNVAQVDISVMLDADVLSQMGIIVVVELSLQIVTDHNWPQFSTAIFFQIPVGGLPNSAAHRGKFSTYFPRPSEPDQIWSICHRQLQLTDTACLTNKLAIFQLSSAQYF